MSDKLIDLEINQWKEDNSQYNYDEEMENAEDEGENQ